METKLLELLNGINRGVIQFRGIYSAWSKKHDMSYNEMLVLYTLRDEDFCTQKQICDSYLLPRQTMNNVFSRMRKAGIIEVNSKNSSGKEKAFVLTEKGREYAAPFLESLNDVETRAVEIMGLAKMRQMTALVREYDNALSRALRESE